MEFNIANQSNLDAARVGFHAAFLEMFGKTVASELASLFTEVPSTAGIEEWDWLGDLPDFEEWKGDRFLAELQAFRLRVVNKDWANGIRVHQNTIKDDKLALIRPKIEQLATKARTHRYRLGMKLLVNGFDGVQYADVSNGLAYDGFFFFSATRPTGSNKLTSALSLSALEAAELLLNSQTTYDLSEPLDFMGTHLIVGPKLAPFAKKLMSQDIVPSGAGTASESNYMKGRYQVIVSPLLRGAHDDYWFLADMSQPIKPMLFQLREEISSSVVAGGATKGNSNDANPRFQRGELWFGAEARYNVGYFEPRAIVGSQVA